MKKEIKLLTGIAAGVVLGAGIAQTTNVFADDEVVATPEEVVEQSNENVKEFSEDAVIEEVTEDEAVVTDTEEEIAVEEDATTSTVAKIGDTDYDSLEAAVSAAVNGDTIQFVADCNETSIKIGGEGVQGKTLTIEDVGTHVINIAQDLWCWNGTNLTLKNCTVNFNGTEQIKKLIRLQNSSTLTLDNTKMTMDGDADGDGTLRCLSDTKTGGAIDLRNDDAGTKGTECTLNVINGSVLTIKNYTGKGSGGSAVMVGTDTQGHMINIKDSTVDISNTSRGICGAALNITVDNSTLKVNNTRGNASNGSHYTITDSTVEFNGNKDNGLSAGNLKVENSKITANDNGLRGIITGSNSEGYFKNSTITISGTKGTSYWCAGFRLQKNAIFTIDSTTKLTISDNDVTGIFLDAGSQLTIAEGAEVLVTRNIADQINCSTKKELAQSGGGLVVRENAVATLSSTTEIYNNHAALVGDDICVEDGGKVILSQVGDDWYLDGDPDCTHKITGWFEDGYNSDGKRWEADVAKEYRYINEITASEIPGIAALKAAHGVITYNVIVNYLDEDGNVIDKQVVVTNIDSFEGYNVTEHDKKNIDGYTYTKTEGEVKTEDPTEQITKDAIVNVIYKKNVTPTPTPETPSNTTTTGTTTGVETDVVMYVGSASVAALGAVSTTLKRHKDLKRVNKNKDLYR